MRDLERALNGLAAAPGELPPSVAAGLKSVRTRRRIVRAGAAAAAMVVLASVATIMVASLHPTAGPSRVVAGRDVVELPDSPFALAVLTRYNRDLDPDRLVLPELAPGADGRPLRPGDARTYVP